MNINDNVELKDILNIAWRYKIILFLIFIISTSLTYWYASTLPNIYKSQAVLSASEENKGGLSALSGQFGGLASLAGVDITSGSNSQTKIAIETLKSRKFVIAFIRKYNLETAIFAAKDWNSSDNQIILDANLFNQTSNEWVREVKLPFTPEPNGLELYEKFIEQLFVKQDKDSGLISIIFEHYSPHLAKIIVDSLILEINEYMRTIDQDNANKFIGYLKTEIAKTDLAESRQLIFEILEEQTKTLMFTKVRSDYVFMVVDPPFSEFKKISPNRLYIVMFGAILGLTLGFLMILIFVNKRDSKTREE